MTRCWGISFLPYLVTVYQLLQKVHSQGSNTDLQWRTCCYRTSFPVYLATCVCITCCKICSFPARQYRTSSWRVAAESRFQRILLRVYHLLLNVHSQRSNIGPPSDVLLQDVVPSVSKHCVSVVADCSFLAEQHRPSVTCCCRTSFLVYLVTYVCITCCRMCIPSVAT